MDGAVPSLHSHGNSHWNVLPELLMPSSNLTRISRSIGFLFLLLLVLSPAPSSAQSDLMDPVLKRLVQAQSTSGPILLKSSGSQRIDVFIITDGTRSGFDTNDLVLKSMRGTVAVASVAVSSLGALALEPHVVSIHGSKTWRPLLDESVPETGADVTRSAYEVTGKGVIVGVIDTGIDWQHLDFRRSDDPTKTRIKYLWDMSDSTGPPPSGEFASSGGTEYTEADINAGLAGTGTVNATDPVGHGTHVAGIAAGNGGGGQYVGVAPEADLVVIKASRDDGQSFSSTDVVTALAYLDARAASLGKPYVANLSLGGQQGPHDGGSAEAVAIDEIFGSGVDGKIAVVAAGNEGNDAIHTMGTLNALSVVDEERTFTATSGTSIGFDIWTEVNPANNNSVFFTVEGPDTLFGPVSGFPFGESVNHTDGNISIVSSPFPSSASGTGINTNISIVIKKTGTWKIRIRGSKGTGSGRFDMWIYAGNADFIAADADTLLHVGTPGASKNAITVGAYVSKRTWTDDNGVNHFSSVVLGDEAVFSSPGPTRDGRQKPEISAPGQFVGSTRSAGAIPGNGSAIFSSSTLLDGGTHGIAQGTSMAAPHVSGAVALILQEAIEQGVSFDAIEVRDALQNSARVDVQTGSVPNPKWGYGKMDVDSLFAVLFGPPVAKMTTETVLSDTSTVVFPTPDGSQTSVAFQSGAVSGQSLTYEHLGRDLPTSVIGDAPPSFPLQYFDIQSTIPDSVIFEANVSVKYTSALLAVADSPAESTLFLFHYDASDSSWRMLDTSVDTVANTATATTTSFSVFALASATPTSIIDDQTLVVAPPILYALDQNYPNPFNPSTTIRFTSPAAGRVVLAIYNITGQHILTLVDADRSPGKHSVNWYGRDKWGKSVSSGVYFYRLSAGAYQESRRMLLLK
jgi:subtilisin family serine protease